jgi:hypothetical protein
MPPPAIAEGSERSLRNCRFAAGDGDLQAPRRGRSRIAVSSGPSSIGHETSPAPIRVPTKARWPTKRCKDFAEGADGSGPLRLKKGPISA